MPTIHSINEFDYSIAIWKIEESEEYFIHKIDFTDFDTHELAEITHPAKRLEWLASRYLLKLLLNKNEVVHLSKKENGKPIIVNFNEHVSISHTSGFAASIQSNKNVCAIDIEQIDPRVMRIERKFMSEQESRDSEGINKLDYLILCWSTKETIFKLLEIPGLIFKEEISIKPFELAASGVLEVMVSHREFEGILKVSYMKIENNYATWCLY